MTDKALPEGRKLKAVQFNSVVSFSSYTSAAVGDKGVLSIQPAAVLPDGDWVGIDKGQRSDGLGIRRKFAGGGREVVIRHFIPWANVGDLSYSE